MPSFDIINYSLRPSKVIQRQIIFGGLRTLKSCLGLDQIVYIGFGSIWFTDFIMAHKLLDVRDMVSIESNDIGYKRALFNMPFATVRVYHGTSSKIIPTLIDDENFYSCPWVVWLDYDGSFDETVMQDTRLIIEQAPENTIFITTFNGLDKKYSPVPKDRPSRLHELFEDVVPDDLSKEECKGDQMQKTLANLAMESMVAIAAESGRLGGFVPAFKVIYKDSAPMVTVGGILPTSVNKSTAQDQVNNVNWRCCPSERIVAPHLTIREAATLQAQLPSEQGLTRKSVQKLGFDLKEEQITAFEQYYREYPAFAQIIA